MAAAPREPDTKEINRSKSNTPLGSGPAAAAGPKTQTVFIHKLYDMLEDDRISHLIWWSQDNESFCVLPGEEFSKVLAQYFKHTNIASFVRQLNMYGFHKMNDQGHGDGESGTARWEFRHLAKQFRKGDTDSLRLIKRRSSKNVFHKETHKGEDTEAHESLKDGETPQVPEVLEVDQHAQQQYHQTLQQQQQDQIPIAHHQHIRQAAPQDQTRTHPEPVASPKVLQQFPNLPTRYAHPAAENPTEMKLHELTTGYFSVKQDNAILQSQLEMTFNEMKKSQFDLIQLVEIMQRFTNTEEDDKNLEYELTNFKHLLLNKFNNFQVVHQQPYVQPPPPTQPQRGSVIAQQYTPNSQFMPYAQEMTPHIQEHNLSRNNSHVHNPNKVEAPTSVDHKQVPQPFPNNRQSGPNALSSPTTSQTRKRSFQQYPFPNMVNDRKENDFTPDGYSSANGRNSPSSSSSEHRIPIMLTPRASNSSLSLPKLSKLSLSNSAVSSYSSNVSTEPPNKLNQLPSVSELDKLIKNGGVPVQNLLNSYGGLKRRRVSEEHSQMK